MNTVLFPGQGAQFKGMGKELFPAYPEQTRKASEILGYSLPELCLEDPDKQLNLTQFTQPALYVVNALGYLHKRSSNKSAPPPDYFAGHSLGEYNALLAAEAFDFETGLKLVQKRGELMGNASGGGMAAVLRVPVDEVRDTLKSGGLDGVDLANFNTPTQVVISGKTEDIGRAEKLFREKKIPCIVLKVSAPFHSRYMKPAQDEFAAFIETFTFSAPRTPVIANATARPYHPQEVASTLVSQIGSPVLWTESIRFLWGRGEMEFAEIGSSILSNMVKEIQRTETPLTIEIPKVPTPEPPAAQPKPAKAAAGTKLPGKRNGTAADRSKPAAARKASKAVKQPRGNAGKAVSVKKAGTRSAKTRSAAAVRNSVDRKTQTAAQTQPKVRKISGKPRRTSSGKPPSPGVPKTKRGQFDATTLGNAAFRRAYGLNYAYLAGGMYQGISSTELVVRMRKAGMMAYFGTAGLAIQDIENAIRRIRQQLDAEDAYGMNLQATPSQPARENEIVSAFLREKVRFVEASGYIQLTPAIVQYRLGGLRRDGQGKTICENRILAKVSRPETASLFMNPPPERIVSALLAEGRITDEQAELSRTVPMSHDICVEADSGGRTDMGMPSVLLPAIRSLHAAVLREHAYEEPMFFGLAGGIGTPEAAAAAFVLGADFILTGSINQCTVESGASEAVKSMLEAINIQDTDYAPAPDLYELGAKIQVLKRGVFFAARARKLQSLFSNYESLDSLPAKVRGQLEERYFKKSLDEAWLQVRNRMTEIGQAEEVGRAEQNPKHKMALVFKSYFDYANDAAFAGDTENRVDFQVHTGPALGAFNQWVADTPLTSWKNRHVDEIAQKLLTATSEMLQARFAGSS